MKLKLLIPAIFLGLAACSTESENKPEPSMDDVIVGNWQYFGSNFYTEEGEIHLKEAHDCYQQSTFNFTSEGIVEYENYSLNQHENTCYLRSSSETDEEPLLWEKLSQGKYRIGSRVRDSIFFPDAQSMEMMSYQNSYDHVNEVAYDRKSDIYIRLD